MRPWRSAGVGAALGLALGGCAPDDGGRPDAPNSMDVPMGCCPISDAPSCDCFFQPGGWAGRGCYPMCDMPATRRVTDDHGCPQWVADDPCRACNVDTGDCDAGR